MKFKKYLQLGVVATAIFCSLVGGEATRAKGLFGEGVDRMTAPATKAAVLNKAPDLADCFHYYKFGSINIEMVAKDKTTFNAGEEAMFTGKIKNENNYPVVKGALYIRVFRVTNEKGGDDIVDQFYALKNVALDAQEEKQLEITWKVPKTQEQGQYALRGYFNVDDSYNLAGLPFYENVYSGLGVFSVASDIKNNVYISRKTVSIDGEQYQFTAPIHSLRDKEAPYKIEYDVVNPTNKATKVNVAYKTFWWDTVNEKNLLKEDKAVVQLAPGQKQRLSYELTPKSHSVYDVLVVAQPEGETAKSFVELRSRITNGRTNARINFPGVTNFPIRKGEQATLFACAHATGDYVVDDGKIKIELADENNRIVESFEYVGKINPEMTGFKTDFTAAEDLDKFSIRSFLYVKDQLVESSNLVYDCEKINPSKCIKKAGVKKTAASGESQADGSGNVIQVYRNGNYGRVILYSLGIIVCIVFIIWLWIKNRWELY